MSNESIEKWRLNEVHKLVNCLEEDFSRQLSKQHIKNSCDYLNIILRTASSAIICMREILCLSSCGYPDGCMVHARLLCEHAIILYFFETSKDKNNFLQLIENYHNNYDIQRLKTLIFSANRADNDKRSAKKFNKELNGLISKTPTYDYKKHDYWWADWVHRHETCTVWVFS